MQAGCKPPIFDHTLGLWGLSNRLQPNSPHPSSSTHQHRLHRGLSVHTKENQVWVKTCQPPRAGKSLQGKKQKTNLTQHKERST